MESARLRTHWDARAGSFDDEPDHGLQNLGVRLAWRRLLGSLLPDPPAKVADLGCGTGSVALLLAESGYDVVGMDFSPRMIEHAQTKADAANSRAMFRIGDAAAPDLNDSDFDVVFARHVVWALPEPADALKQWVRLLVPGGRLVLVEGLWGSGAGLSADALTTLLNPLADHIAVQDLPDEQLWGKPVEDERYAVVAIPQRHPSSE